MTCPRCGRSKFTERPCSCGEQANRITRPGEVGIHGHSGIGPRTLGGDGLLNLPYEPVGGDPIPAHPIIAGGIIVKAGTADHPVTGDPHPVLVFSFAFPNGTLSQDVCLIVERDELHSLIQLVRDAVNGAVNAADQAKAAQ